MKDRYPELPTLPADWLVAPDEQPDYADLPGVVLDETVDLGSLLADAHVAAGHGDDVAIVHHESGRTITFAELAAASDAAAAALDGLGVRAGDRVALRGPNCPDLLVAAIGAWKLGAVVTLVPALARPSELAFYLDDTGPRVMVVAQPEDDEALAAMAAHDGLVLVSAGGALPDGPLAWETLLAEAGPRPVVPTDLDRVAIVWHTGGTTGRPKGCYHTQRRFILGGLSLAGATAARRGQRWLAAAPIGHALGFIHSTNYTLLNGVTLVLVSGFTRPRTLVEAIARHRVDQFTAISATWAGMLHALEELSTVELPSLTRGYAMWQSSSASGVSIGWRARGIELLNNFGSTSFATWVLVPPVDRPVTPAALGIAAPGYDVLAIDPGDDGGLRESPVGVPGRMAVRGPTGLTYWRLPDQQRVDVRGGHTLQDDLIVVDDSGVAEYLGRTDFLISTAGNKVAPAEVEKCIGEHPAVEECLVIGLPDALRQEIVAAFVVLADIGLAGDDLVRELQDLVKQRLAPYKYPRVVEFIDELPRDHVGKVQPRRLRDQVLARNARGGQ